MKRKFIKTITILIGVSMIGSLVSGCKGKEAEAGADATVNNSSSGVVSYPIKTDVKLTYWTKLDPKVSPHSKTLADTEFAKQLEKETGIKVEWLHPAQGQETEQFNIMIASGELPDIIDRYWTNAYAGGPDKAIDDKIILRLNEVIDKYAPNYKKVLEADKTLSKLAKSDKGNIYSFGFIRGDDILTTYSGPILREDWLKELNLKLPETLDEFETVLKAFKEKKNTQYPYTQGKGLDGNFVAGAFGFNLGYYLENGKVAYGPLNSKLKEYLTVMNRWYKDGILDKNFAANDGNAVKANMLNSKSGAFIGMLGGGIGTYVNAMKDKDPKFSLIGCQYPVLNKGDKVKFAQKDAMLGAEAAITAKCKNPEIAARLLDYGYSEKGSMLYNFGTENVSYKMVNGYPTYQDVIMNNPDKLAIGEAMAKYTRVSYDGPFVQRKEYLEQFMVLPQQKETLKLWSKIDVSQSQYPVATLTTEESAEASKLEGDINTYVDEMMLKFIMGAEPLTNIDKFQAQLKSMKVDRVIELRQAAVDRYNKR
jgi:putative aldouronate transport system substrate-binding protein